MTTPGGYASKETNQDGALRIAGVTKYYGDLCVVDDVSLEVQPGEFLSLLGPSGSGKTTTLRIVAGFIRPNNGSVFLDDRNLVRVPPHKRDIGMVFQNYALFPHMTAAENIGFALALRHVPKPTIRQRIDELMGLVRLEGLGDRYPRQLSGGQQQRVALARALSFGPRLLLMDEPLGALDKKLREALQLEIIRISRQLRVTVLYVTHDQQEALVMSDRIAIFNQGAIQQVGSAEDLYERPNSVFVADFVGESNVLRGVLRHQGSENRVVLPTGLSIRVSADSVDRVGLCDGDRAAVVVRPERICLGLADPRIVDSIPKERMAVDLEAHVGEVIYLGSERKYVLALDGSNSVTVRVQQGTEGSEAAAGPDVRLWWKTSDCVVVADPEGASEGLPKPPHANLHDESIADAASSSLAPAG